VAETNKKGFVKGDVVEMQLADPTVCKRGTVLHCTTETVTMKCVEGNIFTRPNCDVTLAHRSRR